MNMRNLGVSVLALGISALSCGVAHAAHTVVYGPTVESYVAASAPGRPYGTISSIDIKNGVVDPFYTQLSANGTISANGNANAVTASASEQSSIDANFYTVDAFSAVNLAAGTLKSSVVQTGDAFAFNGRSGFVQSSLQDTLYFTNTTGGALIANLTYTFDGVASLGTDHSPSGSLGFNVSCLGFACFNEANTPILLAGSTYRAADAAMYYMFGRTGNSISSCFGENIYCGDGSAPFFTTHLDQPDANGLISGFITTQLIIPVGTTSLGIRGILNLDCRGGASCGFGHTGKFGFDALPDGLSFSSASGVFLTEANAVPEPASWAMMIAGFGFVGAAMRRRHRPSKTLSLAA